MRSTRKEICEQFGDEAEMMLSIDDIFFSELKRTLYEVPSLIVDVPPLGKFYFRKAKTNRYNKEAVADEEFKAKLYRIEELYKEYNEDKLQKKYEKFGKESHEAYLLAKEQEKVSKAQAAESKKHS